MEEQTQIEKIQQFRTQLCRCFVKRAAASMNLIDALAAAVNVESPIALSESPAFKRKYASVYFAQASARFDVIGATSQKITALVPSVSQLDVEAYGIFATALAEIKKLLWETGTFIKPTILAVRGHVRQ